MKWQIWFGRLSACFALILVSACSLTMPADGHAPGRSVGGDGSQKPVRPSIGLPASLAGFRDEGTFLIFFDGEQVCTIDFKWQPDGTFYNKETWTNSAIYTQSITPDKDGRWLRIDDTGYAVVREGTIKKRVERGKIVATEDIQAGELLYLITAPALYSQAIRQYDKGRGGKQSFHTFFNFRSRNVSLEREGKVERTIGASTLQLTSFGYTFLDGDKFPGTFPKATVWVDAGDKVYLVAYSNAGSARQLFVRQGYETLRQAN